MLRSALTIGNFDGVHRGHRALIEEVTAWKRAQPQSELFKSVVLTFEPHPIEILKPGTLIKRLCSNNEKIGRLQKYGIDEVHVIPFNVEFSQIPARDFFQTYLIDTFKAAFIAVGHDFYFGHQKSGSPGKIIDWCEELKIPAKLVDPIEADGDIVSSSRIRKLIEEGQMIAASRLLGRSYSLSGEVVHGDKKGRLLGFPTANMIPQSMGLGARCLPSKGVYLSASTVEGKTFPSITNVGVKPTLKENSPLIVETHLLQFSGDLYGKLLTVEFSDRLRSERKFESFEALQKQIQQDIALASQRLSLK